MRRVRKAQEARSKAAKAQAQANAQSAPTGGMPGGMGGGMPGAGPFPQGFAANDLGSLLMDPEIITAFQVRLIITIFLKYSSHIHYYKLSMLT